MMRSRSRSAIVCTTLVLIFASSLARHGQRAASSPGSYAVTDLGILTTAQSGQANDVNEVGQVVGAASNRAFLWEDGVITALPGLGGSGGTGAAINESGQIVGTSNLNLNSTPRAVLWQNGGITNLTPNLTSSSDSSAANGINDTGQVAGHFWGINNYATAFLWQNGVMTELQDLGAGGASAVDINNAGQVAGWSVYAQIPELGSVAHPILWENGVMTDLGLFPGDDDGWANAINEAGQIAGASGRTEPETYKPTYRAFVYENGVKTALPVPSTDSYAVDINDSGVVVGTMKGGPGVLNYDAFIYTGGVVTNLNSLISSSSGLHLRSAAGINNAGQIVGVAIDANNRTHAFLLTPLGPDTPIVNIGNASVTEGHSGTQSANFTVTLSAASSQAVTVSYSTANGSAAAGSDYQAASGTVTFDAGQTSRSISVLVDGDRTGEPNETFLVNLSLAEGGVLGDAQGAGTILDDEPRITISDVSKNEGQSQTTQFIFTVSLSPASDAAVSVNFATADGSATSVEDYTARTGTLAFNAGETSKTVAVTVRGDKKLEANEVFFLNLSGAAGALVADNQGVGLVRNDDR